MDKEQEAYEKTLHLAKLLKKTIDDSDEKSPRIIFSAFLNLILAISSQSDMPLGDLKMHFEEALMKYNDMWEHKQERKQKNEIL